MKKIFWSLLTMTLLFANSLTAQSVINQTFDTLIVNVCRSCDYGPKTKCFCMSSSTDEDLNQFIKEQGANIIYLIIEHPSRIMYRIDFSLFSNLKFVELWGNDIDNLKALHPDLLKIKTLQELTFSGVIIPEVEVERLKKKAPSVKIEGIDATGYFQPNDTLLDLTLVVKKGGKYALWSSPYEYEPQYIYSSVEDLMFGRYICLIDSGVVFKNTRLNIEHKFTDYQEIYYRDNYGFEPDSRYVVMQNGYKKYDKIKYVDLIGKLDADGNYTETEKYDFLDSLKYMYGGKVGLLSPDFEVVIPVVYSFIQFPAKVHYREFASVVPDNKIEFVNWVNSSELSSPTYNAQMNSSQLILLHNNNLKGACNFKGEIVVPIKYLEIIPIFHGDTTYYYCFNKLNRADVVDVNGSIVKKIEFPKKNCLQYPPKSEQYMLIPNAYPQADSRILMQILKTIVDNKQVRFYDEVECSHSAVKVPINITTIEITGVSSTLVGSELTPFSISLIDEKANVKLVLNYNDLIALGIQNKELLDQLVKIKEFLKKKKL